LDLSFNPIQRVEDYRLFVKHICKKLIFLDTKFFVNQEIQKSKELFKGRLTQEILNSKISLNNKAAIEKINFDSMGLCHYDKEFNLK
jgi:hypothetical protein